MIDFRSHFEVKKGWWIEERSSVPCILPADGLLAVFRTRDVEPLMDQKYPHQKYPGRKVWWFNETKDREIAEDLGDGRIYANPQVLMEHFLNRK